ncbi:MAG: helix-hairpin-helix domain-containing protein [Deltaproteobacteria bacterium]|nr:helix-hairpin-helix domain-containing protein [Deltaproteobacteria bacterium]
MRISERQRDGAIVAVVIAVIVYTLSNASFLLQSKVCDLPYRDKGHDQLVVGIAVNAGSQGIFWLPRNSKVYDLLNAAGIGNLEKFNEKTLHTQLSRGHAVYIESDCTIEVGEMDNARKIALNIPININKATLEDLMLIPGIGETTALRIIQFRETSGGFRTLEDLMKIRGIKEKKFAFLKRYLYAGKIS